MLPRINLRGPGIATFYILVFNFVCIFSIILLCIMANLFLYILFAVMFGTNKQVDSKNREFAHENLFHSAKRQNLVGDHKHDFDHESILGSHTAADEFDQLSPAESKRRLNILALKKDENTDGYIDRKELTDWVLNSFSMLTDEEAMDQLLDTDEDGDGKITWHEHVIQTYGPFSQNTPEEYQMMENDKDLFDGADENRDGYLDAAEFPAFSHPEEFDHMHDILYTQLLERRDADKDGLLNVYEFLTDSLGNSPDPKTEHYIVEKDRFEHEFDLDNDGKLNKEEVLIWIIPNNLEMAETEADHLIASSDDDQDEKLSFEEILNHHDIFVGSEATDFGEHLNKITDEL